MVSRAKKNKEQKKGLNYDEILWSISVLGYDWPSTCFYEHPSALIMITFRLLNARVWISKQWLIDLDIMFHVYIFLFSFNFEAIIVFVIISKYWLSFWFSYFIDCYNIPYTCTLNCFPFMCRILYGFCISLKI